MKRINLLIRACAIVTALFTLSCAEKFEESYDLAIDATKYSVAAEVGTLPITVYCSGRWTAALTTESEWATLDCTAGGGITTIHVDCAENTGLSRSVELVLQGAGLEKKITILQQSGITAPTLEFGNENLAFANGSYAVRTDLQTNLPKELLQQTEPTIAYPAESEAWITEATYEPLPAGDEELPQGMHAGRLSFKTLPNTSGEVRTATVGILVTDASGVSYGDTFTVTQSTKEAVITLENDKAPIEGGVREVAFSSTIGVPLSELQVEVAYKDPAVSNFISDVTLSADRLSYTLSENTTTAKRYATITLSYTDLEGTLTTGTTAVVQRVTAQPREIPIADLRALFGATDTTYEGDEDYTDYIICRVIGDCNNPNMDQNINVSANLITTDENDRTNYVQSEDGRYGFRLKYVTKADNTLCRYDKVKILLDGLTLSKELNPTRYTLRNLQAANIEKLSDGSASDLPAKSISISALSDDDLYTYRTLTDMEFSVKQGAYTNVREYDAIDNPYRKPFVRGSQAQTAKDGAANLLYDGNNSAIYMLVNMNCAWRRNGQTVPQGVGSVSGIIVHTPMERWGGNVGRYSVRPFDETDIAISRGEASSFTTLAEWKLDKGSLGADRGKVTDYKWDSKDGRFGWGNATNSLKALIQNKLLATSNNTGGKAILYSENCMLNQNPATDRVYPQNLVNGYRGLDVSTYTSGSKPAFGMSNRTMMSFYGNLAGWYQWDGNTWNGKTNGIVMEFPTSGVSGTSAAVNFSIAAGRDNTAEAFCSWGSAHSFPVYWKVEYATSTDDGSTWSEYTEVNNAATGEGGFEMRSLPWCINNSTTRTSIHNAENQSGISTQSDFGFGIVPYRFVLPAEIFGKSLVRVRITPSSDIIAAWNVGLENYNLGQTYRGLRMMKTYPGNMSSGVFVEDLCIQYK